MAAHTSQTAVAAGTADGSVTITSVEPRRVYALHSGSAPVPVERIGQIVGPLFDQLADNLRGARVEPGFPAVAAYEGVGRDGGCAKIWVAYTVPQGQVAAPAPAGVDYFELPGVEQLASLTHHGDIANVRESWAQLWSWVETHGYRPVGLCREVYLKDMPYPREEWVVELQIPIEAIEQ